ncbi:MAG: hypothetical protein ABSE17_02275 [Candidatus Levyibacteriota bacterium]
MSNEEAQKSLLLKILQCDTGEKLRELIEKEIYFSQGKWLPYGGFSNNTGIVNGQMREPENSLIEKITNSIDAILMRKCQESGIDPKDQTKSPKDMEDAINIYFGGREQIRKNRSELAKQMIRVTAEGKREKPTITILDTGEGQTPDAIPKTILSLQQEIKKKIRFVYGTYNQGGSSALGFCHDSSNIVDYIQLVICRRAQSISDKEADSGCFGFTIVRSRYDEEGGNFTYEYFVDKDNKIPRFSFNEPIRINGFDFSEGCVIRLYGYELTNAGNIVFRGLNEAIEKKLSYSPLPMFLNELRNYGGGTEYTIFGFREKMERLDSKIMHPGFPNDYPVDLGEIGKKAIRIFILQHKSKHKENIDSYLAQKEKIFFIRNGMTLHSENASWLREYCGLPDLAPYMFIFVDISEISAPLANMLHSGREQFRNTPTTRLTLERLKIFLDSFKELDEEYGSLTAADTEIEDKDLRKQLAKEAIKDPELKKLFDLGEDFPAQEDKGTSKVPYQGEHLPTKFELVGSDTKFVEEKTFSRISFKTEASDDLFIRAEDRGEYNWTESDKFFVTFGGIHRGVINFRIDAKPYIEIGSTSEITFQLTVPNKGIRFSSVVKFQLINTPDYMGEHFPTYFNLTKKVFKIPVGTERKLILSTDVVNDYFTREKDKGTLEVLGSSVFEFTHTKLSDGFLEIGVKHKGDRIEQVEDIRINVSDDAGHKFNVAVPVEIVPPNYEPNLNLPEPKMIRREDWDNMEPPFQIHNIARIPQWSKLEKVYINVDSIIFEELKQLDIVNKEKAQKYLINQIYFASIWLYLELKNLKSNDGDTIDIKMETFDMAIRGMRKLILNNIKKLIR